MISHNMHSSKINFATSYNLHCRKTEIYIDGNFISFACSCRNDEKAFDYFYIMAQDSEA